MQSLTKKVVKRKPKPKELTITIQSEEEDDWMKSLPGYKDEVKLHEELAAKLDKE